MNQTDPATHPNLTKRFTTLLDGLRLVLRQHSPLHPLSLPLIGLIWNRINRLVVRFAVIAARTPTSAAPAGEPATPKPRRPRPEAPPRQPDPLPTCFGWLLRLMPPTPTTGCAAAATRYLFVDFLADPEMLALIAANPAIGSVLRPLCHILGIKVPAALHLPKKPRAAKPAPSADPDEPAPIRKPRRTNPPRPSPFPVKPVPPTPWQTQYAFYRWLKGEPYFQT